MFRECQLIATYKSTNVLIGRAVGGERSNQCTLGITSNEKDKAYQGTSTGVLRDIPCSGQF